MKNDILLQKYKIKLSVYFALFVMFFLYLIQILFVGIQYISANLDLKEALESRVQAIENIIKNKQIYQLQISQDDTLQKIILRTLEQSVVMKNNKIMIDFWNLKDLSGFELWVTNLNKKKYFLATSQIEHDTYSILVYAENNFNFENFFRQIGWYLVVLSPFFIVFYFIGYTFVGRNFRVIEESIHSLEDFTAQVNHEMKTPLSEIISTLSLAQKIHNYPEAVDISLNSANKLHKILESIIGMAHLSDISYRKEKLDVVGSIDDIVKEFESEMTQKQIILRKDIPQTKHEIKANKEHVYLCIKNIFSNAIKYSHQKWIIELSYHAGVFQIKDYWVGIDKANLKKIFQRYFRESYTSQEWFGLWLALVKKIVDINHWTLEVESQKDECTCITLKF